MAVSILKELQERLPKDAKISEVKFEGSEIVIYTKSKDFFTNGEATIKDIVRSLKKRLEVRPDLSITMDPEKTKKIIEKIVPEDAGIKAIYFEPELGKVIIESQKPGLVIGKGGETYRKIKAETLWLPKIERAPAINSDIVRAVRNLLHSEIDYRKKFLNKIGQKINTETKFLEKEKEWVRLTMLGAGRQVGRSCLFVQTRHSNVLLDCGASPGSVEDPPYLDVPEFDIDKLDAVVISHSHIDHMAYIPWLYANGYTGPVYSTAPVRDLSVLLALDYVDIMHKNGVKVPYQKKAVEKMVKHSIALDYGEVSDITPDMRLTLQPAGHLLGSSQVHLHIGEGLHNIVYTGDYKFGQSRLFDPAFTDFQRIETLITEATYGGHKNIFPRRDDVEKSFWDMLDRTLKRGGKVVIPSFAVGRAQEIMTLIASKPDFNYPVYMEGMIWDATAIHTAYPEYLSKSLQRSIFRYGKNPFISDIFKRVAPKERQSVLDNPDPCVVVATSGMLIGGPVMEYIKAFANEPKNLLMFVGYQAEGTLGRRIQGGWRELTTRGEDGKTKVLKINMEVDTAYGFSPHSDRKQIVNYIRRLRNKPERIIVNHGEPRRCIELARDLSRITRAETFAPKNLETVRLN